MTEEEILYAALDSEFGIEVEIIGNYQQSLTRIYSARRKDPDLEILQISRALNDKAATHIWIVKQSAPPPQPAAQALKENPKGEGPLFSLADLLGDE